MSRELEGKIAVVTGSSRGIGRGTAIALAEKGATVYITGRSAGDGPLTIDTTVKMVNEAGGKGIAVQVDHGDDAQIAALFGIAVDPKARPPRPLQVPLTSITDPLLGLL